MKTRYLVQTLVAVFLLTAGIRFYLFVSHFRSGTPFVSRPPSVEAFLPISALVALKAWIATGIYDRVHPAGLAIFIIILATGWFFKKGFCSWICPIGALSERFWQAGARLYGRNLELPRCADWALMTLKHLLLYLFLRFIFFGMSGQAALQFLDTSYNKVADVKMLDFFTVMTPTRATILILLGLFSLLIKNFWCRYLCPYGALLGILGLLSPIKIRRNDASCTSCRLCDRACAHRINVSRSTWVHSPECTSCLECINRCPRDEALGIAAWSPLSGWSRSPLMLRTRAYSLAFLGTFFLLLALAMLTGHWQTSLSYEDYQALIPIARVLTHP